MAEARGGPLSRDKALALRDIQWDAYNKRGQAHNPGLVLERFQPVPRGTAEHYSTFLREVCELSPPGIYAEAYEEWKATLLSMPGVRAREFETRGRVIVGLGAESVRETGITLLRLYGVPVLPGSAIKGLARRYLARRGEAPSEAKLEEIATVMFGRGAGQPALGTRRSQRDNGEEIDAKAAYLTYFDAWYVPGSALRDKPLRRDVITVHHPRYYRSQGKLNEQDTLPPVPWDLDDPNPVAFISARGRFLVAVRGPDAEGQWAEQALMILERALGDWGIGAKTSSGYGRLVPVGDVLPRSPEEEAAQQAVAVLVAEIAALSPTAAIERAGGVPRIRPLSDRAMALSDREALPALRAVRDKLREAGVLESWKTQPWLKALLARIVRLEQGGAR
ncbi:MAG: type III-B CRISPR module RAMP protein Cmr6 [Thermomicrobiales bacterium]|nr:MAG: type III-B CRISPR module RAMP protein Cmr6 [Thermomicrobiales bacterium]